MLVSLIKVKPLSDYKLLLSFVNDDPEFLYFNSIPLEKHRGTHYE